MFIDGIDKVKLVTDRKQLSDSFLLRVSRKICHDATIQINNVLFETDPCLAGKRLEVRYEPEWLEDKTKPLRLFEDGKQVGEARQIRFFDNAHVKRKFPGNRRKSAESETYSDNVNEDTPKNTISFADLAQGGKEHV